MMKSRQLTIIAAGFFAGLLYLAAAGTMDSVLLIYTPFFPLLLLGLSMGAQPVLWASLVGCAVSGAALGINGALVFLILFTGPCFIFIRQILRRMVTERGDVLWFPVGEVLTRLSLYAASMVIFLTYTLYDAAGGEGMRNLFPEAVAGEPEWMEIARQWLVRNAHFVLGGTAWVQISAFYGLAVLANFLLAGYGRNLRANLSIYPFTAGPELLICLMVAGFLSLFVTDIGLALAAKAVFIALLYPYFLMGISRMHRYSLLWPSRRFWLTMVYFFMLLSFPLLPIGFIGLGLAAQARQLSNWFNRGPGQTS